MGLAPFALKKCLQSGENQANAAKHNKEINKSKEKYSPLAQKNAYRFDIIISLTVSVSSFESVLNSSEISPSV